MLGCVFMLMLSYVYNRFENYSKVSCVFLGLNLSIGLYTIFVLLCISLWSTDFVHALEVCSFGLLIPSTMVCVFMFKP